MNSSTGELRSRSGRGARERGVTVVELVFAMASSVVIILAAVGVSTSVSDSSTELVSGFENLRGNIEGIDRLRRDLARSKIVDVGDHGESITFALPVREAGDTSILTEEGEIRWGVSDRRGIRRDGFCRIVFRKQKTLVENILKKDLNQDGDQGDTFHVGRLHMVTDGADELGLKKIKIILAGDNLDGDVDGDGEPDPLFSLSVNNIVTIRLSRPLRDGGVKTRVVRVWPIASEIQR
jgi:hypothetical protein